MGETLRCKHCWEHFERKPALYCPRCEKELGPTRADEATRLLRLIKWKSAEKDNMEFSAKITCYQMDKIRAFLEQETRNEG